MVDATVRAPSGSAQASVHNTVRPNLDARTNTNLKREREGGFPEGSARQQTGKQR